MAFPGIAAAYLANFLLPDKDPVVRAKQYTVAWVDTAVEHTCRRWHYLQISYSIDSTLHDDNFVVSDDSVFVVKEVSMFANGQWLLALPEVFADLPQLVHEWSLTAPLVEFD